MTSSNLAICVGPCILWSGDAQVVTGAEYAADVSRVGVGMGEHGVVVVAGVKASRSVLSSRNSTAVVQTAAASHAVTAVAARPIVRIRPPGSSACRVWHALFRPAGERK